MVINHLINTNFNISGHCLPPSSLGKKVLEQFRIGFGENDLVRMYNAKNYVDIEDAFVFPGFQMFNDGGAINDIALIKFKEPIAFNNMVQPACLPDVNTDLYDGPLKVIYKKNFHLSLLEFNFHVNFC